MPKVLHIGPCDTPGGMANVMRTLAEYPPEGWEADLLSSHVVGSPWAKWKAYRRARKELIRRCNSEHERPDVVHIHTAADWSWRRKARFLSYAQKQNMACVVHVHSGKFDSWLGLPSSRRSKSIRRHLSHDKTRTAVLTDEWKNRLGEHFENIVSVSNPLDPTIINTQKQRDKVHLLLMGRNDPVKGHAFAIQVAKAMKTTHPDLQLTMTGANQDSESWIHAKGWVTDSEKRHLLETASILLLPSKHEGQPMVVIEALGSGLPVLAHEHLHSLPLQVTTAEPSVAAWCAQLSKMIEFPQEIVFSPGKHDISNVQQRWVATYRSCLQD
jgi:glycosyltransferase involved in cell wall biosynthesis